MKRSGGLVDAAGKPAGTAVPLVDAAGVPLGGVKEPVHITEDIDAVLRSRGGQSSMKPTAKPPTKPTAMKPPMKSGSDAMLNVYDAKEGDRIEVCPEACMLVQEIVMWLEETKGRERSEG